MKLAYEDYDYGQNKDPKIFRDKENKSILEYMLEYRILFCNTEHIQLSNSSQNGLTPKFFWDMSMK